MPFQNPLDLEGMFVCPPLGRILPVRGVAATGAVLQYDDQWTQNMPSTRMPLFASVAAALPFCDANRGDVILCLPYHTENIATGTAWAMVAGVRIVGLGAGNSRPTFTFTAAGSTVAVNASLMSFENLKFICDGTAAVTVTQAFNITGEGASFIGCDFHLGTSNTQKCATLATVSAANCRFLGNRMLADTNATLLTTMIALGTASTGADGFQAIGNFMKGATGAVGTGLIVNIGSTATSNFIYIGENFIHQWKASSTKGISFAGNMATTGCIRKNTFRIEGGAGNVTPVDFSGTGVDLTFDDNKVVNAANQTGALVGTASS
jgi:hypothetical protein